MALTMKKKNLILQDVREPYFEWLNNLSKLSEIDNNLPPNLQQAIKDKGIPLTKTIKDKTDAFFNNISFFYCSEGDSEKWEVSIDSYDYYPEDKYKFTFEKPKFRVKRPGILKDLGSIGQFKGIKSSDKRITADILTNIAIVYDKKNRKYNDVEVDELLKKKFLQYAYTIGNMCPVWGSYSPSGDNSLDTVWHKLATTDYQNDNTNMNINNRSDRDEKDIRKRGNSNYFMILDIDSPKETIRQLHLQDYFKANWDLFYDEYDIKKMEEKKQIKFIIDTIKLIIQRGYRIVKPYYKDTFEKNEIKEIKELFKEVFDGINTDNLPEDVKNLYEPIHCIKDD